MYISIFRYDIIYMVIDVDIYVWRESFPKVKAVYISTSKISEIYTERKGTNTNNKYEKLYVLSIGIFYN